MLLLFFFTSIFFFGLFIIIILFNLICSYNNVIFLLNFLCLLFIFSFILFRFNLISVGLFILIIYATLINLLFLVNGLLLISSYSYVYYSISSVFLINNLNLDITINFDAFIINIFLYHNALIYFSIIHFYNLCFLSAYCSLLNIGLNRLTNFIFDNSLFSCFWFTFLINLTNISKFTA